MKLTLFALAVAAHWLPTHSLTPGVTNAAVTQDDLKTTICRRGGYTKSIRPPMEYTDALKKKQLAHGYTDKNPRDYEEDHLIALEIGGNPTSPKNLWPEPRRGKWNASVKDKLEDQLHKLVCTGKLPLKTAQHAIATDWIKAYNQYVGKLDYPTAIKVKG